ncbi:MAG: Yip1 family protein [Anaerolineales bacterium]|jgi:hypothetical protein
MCLRYSTDLFFRPQLAFRALLNDRRRVGYGILGNLVLAVIYFVGISVTLEMNELHVPQNLVLNIPPERYYAYERFFIFPASLAGTILAAGVIRLGAREWKGDGRFEDLFALLGFSFVVVAVVIGLPDLIIGILTGFGVLAPLGFSYIGPHVWLGTLWFLLLTILAVKEVERLGWGQSIVLGIIGFTVNGVVQFIFIR